MKKISLILLLFLLLFCLPNLPELPNELPGENKPDKYENLCWGSMLVAGNCHSFANKYGMILTTDTH
ncbi:MAG: hypothetical protein H7A23_14945 [Leptospiraceae bacterium]|nr:hypothetical protein [Leptospiraceae bacterium]